MASEESQPLYWHYSGFDGNFQIRGRTLFVVAVVLSFVLLLVTLLFVYARWVCKSHNLRSTASDATSAPHLAHAPPPRPQGLDAATINGFPIILHQSSTTTKTVASESECCSICLGEFQDGDKVKVLPKCNHFYHCECVDRWFAAAQSSCPLCRSSLLEDSPV